MSTTIKSLIENIYRMEDKAVKLEQEIRYSYYYKECRILNSEAQICISKIKRYTKETRILDILLFDEEQNEVSGYMWSKIADLNNQVKTIVGILKDIKQIKKERWLLASA